MTSKLDYIRTLILKRKKAINFNHSHDAVNPYAARLITGYSYLINLYPQNDSQK